MHSLSFSTVAPASPASPPPGPDAAPGSRDLAGFAALLAALPGGGGVAPDGAADAVAVPGSTEAEAPALPGTRLPGAALAGRFLPGDVPLAGEGQDENWPEQAGDGPLPAESGGGALAVALLAALPPPPAALTAPAAAPPPAAAPAPAPSRAVPETIPTGRGDGIAADAPRPDRGHPVTLMTLAAPAIPTEPAPTAPVAEATEPSLRPLAAAGADSGAHGQASAGGGGPEQRAGDQTTRSAIDLSALQAREPPSTPSPAAAPGSPAATPPAGAAAPAIVPAPVDPLGDLAAIVDRLAAAREALAPAAASLALAHAEFGALTLRFEQQQDGRLLVGLSAQDADAQRALAAALGTPSSGGERMGSDPQQQGHSTRGGGAALPSGREAGGGGQQAQDGHARRDTRDTGWHAAPAGDGRPAPSADIRRSGIFA